MGGFQVYLKDQGRRRDLEQSCLGLVYSFGNLEVKVVDEIFEIDNIVKREKQLRHLSRCCVQVAVTLLKLEFRFVKDVFGLKIVVGDEEQVRISWPFWLLRPPAGEKMSETAGEPPILRRSASESRSAYQTQSSLSLLPLLLRNHFLVGFRFRTMKD
eukprot:752096-Hanusia_phi.AAC.5